jgi:hypothetical protein
LVNALGHREDVAQNMGEAIDLAISEHETFDLLLSDISLQDGDGWELWRCWPPPPASDCDKWTVQCGRFNEKPESGFLSLLAQTH